MTRQDNESADEERTYGGARVSIRDPRMSKLLGWFWTFLGATAVTGVYIVGNNLYAINMTLAADAVYKQELARQVSEQRALNDRQEDHINAVDRRVYTLEGRNLRGSESASRGR